MTFIYVAYRHESTRFPLGRFPDQDVYNSLGTFLLSNRNPDFNSKLDFRFTVPFSKI